MADVFLSYSREDQAVARRFAEELQQEGFSVWWDQALAPGDTFDEATQRALDAAGTIVVLWSRRSVESRWVRAEATQGLAGNRLVPVMIEACRRPIMFELTHTADLTGWNGDDRDARWRAFVEGLRGALAAPRSLDAAGPSEPGRPPTLRARARWRIGWRGAVAISALSALAAGLTAAALTSQRTGARPVPQPLHLALPLDDQPLGQPFGVRHLAISRDGSRIAHAGRSGLRIRQLSSTESVTVPGEAINPFFSPDGAWLGFVADGRLVKVPATGGVPLTLTEHPERPLGASWSGDGWIVFATSIGLFRVAADGGEPEPLARPDATRHELRFAWPALLPGDHALLYTVLRDEPGSPPQIVWRDLRSGETRTAVTGGTGAWYSPSGHLVYAAGGELLAIRFDPGTGRTDGQPIRLRGPPIDIAADNAAAEFALSADGTLVAMPLRRSVGTATQLYWVDRAGNEESFGLEPGLYSNPQVSPDGRRVAIDVSSGGNRDVWIWDTERKSLTRLTNSPTEDMTPEWSPDGRVFFASTRDGSVDVYSQAADGASPARLEYGAPGAQFPQTFTPDGRQLVVYENFNDHSVLDVGHPPPRPLLKTGSRAGLAKISPDGRWLAYESRESGTQVEIYVRPFPDTGSRREKVSLAGGRYPLWDVRGSNELYYLDPAGDLISASIRLDPSSKPGKTTKLFRWAPPPAAFPTGRAFGMSPVDGRFVMTRTVRDVAGENTNAAIVLNWDRPLHEAMR